MATVLVSVEGEFKNLTTQQISDILSCAATVVRAHDTADSDAQLGHDVAELREAMESAGISLDYQG